MKQLLLLTFTMTIAVSTIAQKRTYEYDELQRLEKTHYWKDNTKTSTVTYSYDAVGNRLSKVVTVYCITPSEPLVNSAERCGPGSITLTASDCSADIKWYSASTGGTLFHTGESLSRYINSSSESYFAACETSSSCASERVEAVATMTPQPSPPVLTASINTVYFNVSSILSATGCNGGQVLWSNEDYGNSRVVSPTENTFYTANCVINDCVSEEERILIQYTDCPTSLNHSGSITTYSYQAAEDINSSGKVNSGIDYRAGESITLSHGFEITDGNTFSATIEGCSFDSADDLIAHYSFNGNINDVSGNGNSMNWPSNATLTTDRYGLINNAYDFPGGGYNIGQTGGLAFCTNTITLNAWVNFPSDGGGPIINNGLTSSTYQLSTTGVIGSGGLSATYANVPSNEWVMLTGILSGKTAKFYMNGQLVSDGLSSTDYSCNNSNQILIGGIFYYAGGAETFNGKMDDLRFYSKALTDIEVEALYKQEKP